MALTTERVKLFFEWFLFIGAIFIAITILYILLVLLFEVPKYIKQLVRYLVEYLTRRRVWMQRTQLSEATGDVEFGRGIVEDRRDQQPAVIPQASQVNLSQQFRRDDQGRRGNVGPMF
ncbi:movement protein [Banana bunchy top virus]|uniref:Movement protein n=1 Tax=Banana bunchy top virus TaxID=12585 RepID=A0A0R7FEP1_BBTV|nr:movement protein [Banana bunchy top virus]